MSQKSLITEPEFVGVENAMPAAEQLPAVIEPAPEVDSMAIRDLRAGFMMMKPEAMTAALAEFRNRRVTFRTWLKEQLAIGTHYGYAPGTEPKFANASRKDCDEKDAVYTKQWKKAREGSGGEWMFIPLTQWRPKPPLYKAGADFLCDLLGARDEYEADLNAWKQLGEPKGTFVMTCRLISRTTEECLGEGRGCRKVGTKGGDENNAIKMAKKSAKCDAVINAWGLSDLFTQDDPVQPPVENPDQDPNAPKVQPRSERFTRSDIETLYRDWQSEMSRQEHTKEFFTKVNFAEYCQRHAQARFDVTKAENWTEGYMTRVRAALQGGLA